MSTIKVKGKNWEFDQLNTIHIIMAHPVGGWGLWMLKTHLQWGK